MKALYLEPDEEITSVIDRLREIEDEEVAIVAPKRAGLLQSIVNLKLLRFQAEQQKKRISLVTTDKTGRNLASAVGLTVYQKLPEGQAKAAKERTESAVREPGQGIPIKFRRKPPEEKEAETSAEPPPIGFKKGALPDASDEESEAAAAPEPAPPPPLAKPPAPNESQPAAPAAEDPEPTPRSEAPAHKAALSNLKVPKVSWPKVKLPALPRRKAGGRKGLRLSRNVAIAVATVVLIGAGTAAAVVLPKATVTVTAKTAPLTAEVPLTFSTRAPAVDPENNVIPAKTIEITRSGSRQVSSSGRSEGGEAASGEIVVVNTFSRNQSLVARTRFQAPDGRVFRAQSGIVVPAGGRTTVRVVADQGGAAGNLPAGTRLSVPGLRGSEAVYGQVETPLIGGTDSATVVVSAEDVERARQELGEQLVRDGVAEAKGKLVGYEIDPKIAATAINSSRTDPPAGAAAPTFTITGEVRITYFAYLKQDRDQVLDPDLKAKLPAGSELVEPRTETFAISQASRDQLVGTLKTEAFSAAEVSKDTVKEEIRGKSPDEARQALLSAGRVSDIQIELSPFWVRSVPDSLQKIDVRFRPGTAASPSPSPAPSAALTPAGTPIPQI